MAIPRKKRIKNLIEQVIRPLNSMEEFNQALDEFNSKHDDDKSQEMDPDCLEEGDQE